MEVSQGQLLAGKYRVERVLGRGGMGVVVAAHHIHLDEKVAIKFLLPEAVANAEVVGRFVREARAAVRIKSEHVARVSDVGSLEGGEPYMVMECLEGSDLAAWLLERGALPVEQAVEFVLQASEAIAEAHALGIVHRDLKPANLFVVRRADGLSSIKVLDFGISKVSGLGGSGVDANFTRTTAVVGSPLYMPPEQMAASKTVDERADIWALGVVLYELIAGQAPFMGETLPEVCIKIAIEPPRDIRSFRPEVPQGLEAVILRCLEKDRDRRYRNVAELAHALSEFGPKRARNSVERISRTIEVAGMSRSALTPPPWPDIRETLAEPTPLVAGSGTEAPWGRTAVVPGKGKRTALALSVLTIAALGGLALGVSHWRSSFGPVTDGSAAPAPPARSAPVPKSTALQAPPGIATTPAALASTATTEPAASAPAAMASVAPAIAAATATAHPAVASTAWHPHPTASAVVPAVPHPTSLPPSGKIYDDR